MTLRCYANVLPEARVACEFTVCERYLSGWCAVCRVSYRAVGERVSPLYDDYVAIGRH